MVARRIRLHTKLESIIGTGHAFFQPPEEQLIGYPCVIYQLSDINTKYADNSIYQKQRVYQLILVDENPDSDYVELLLDSFEHIRFIRCYASDGLNHWVYSLYF